MFKKLVLILAIVAVVAVAAFAGSVPSTTRCTFTLAQPSIIQGTVLKAGDYRLILTASKVTITTEGGKNLLLDVPVTVEMQDKKFDTTTIQLDNASGKMVISQIRLGGTKTKLIFN